MDFVAFFPSTSLEASPESFGSLRDIYKQELSAQDVSTSFLLGAALLRTKSFDSAPDCYIAPHGAGWIVSKGIIFDNDSGRKADLRDFLELLLAGCSSDLNRFEGSFAVAAWDAREKQGWAINDQAATLSLYYGEKDGGLYVTTNALSLARALSLGLDRNGVEELLARSILLAPYTLFRGLRRLNIGQHVRYASGVSVLERHWSAYASPEKYPGMPEATENLSRLVLRLVSRYSDHNRPVLSDLTAGFDTRLILSALCAAGIEPRLTVNGPETCEDVAIAKQIAHGLGLELAHFDIPSFWTTEITPEMRRELVYRTGGDITFPELYHQLLSRPGLAKSNDLHLYGSGGEYLRFVAWSQEFFGIGRRKQANVNNLMTYRFLKDKLPSPKLFRYQWMPEFSARLKSRIEEICSEVPNARNTQQLDAVYVWKLTSHSSLYQTSAFNWLPTSAPFLTASFIKATVALPWKMRLTSQLQRKITYKLCPEAAAFRTRWGSTAEPTNIRNIHLLSLQLAKRGLALTGKWDRVFLNGTFSDLLGYTPPAAAKQRIPFLTTELKELLNPGQMYSRGLYKEEGLSELLGGNQDDWNNRRWLIARVATIEEVCRELSFKPEPDFFNRREL